MITNVRILFFTTKTKMSSKRKSSDISNEEPDENGVMPEKKSHIDDILSLIDFIPNPIISKRLYKSNIIKILQKIKTKQQLINLCNNFTEDIWSTRIMKYIVKQFIKKDKTLFIYIFDKFVKNFVFRHEAEFFINFNLKKEDFYNLPDNCEEDYELLNDYFGKKIKKLKLNEIYQLFHIGIDSIDKYNKLLFDSDDENDTKCEIVQNIKNIYFNQIGYMINKDFWQSHLIINKAIECNFFILQNFCTNHFTSEIIKKCDIEQKIIFFHQLKDHYPIVFSNQLEYFERFEKHYDEPLDKKHVIDVVHTLSNPILRKKEKGRELESFYELLPL